jgi:hypothetical protein
MMKLGNFTETKIIERLGCERRFIYFFYFKLQTVKISKNQVRNKNYISKNFFVF